MRIAEMDWRMVEDWVRHDDRCALPLGSTEQHAGLSLATDAILAERVAVEAAEPLGVPVFPALPYGLTPYFTAFPGTVTLRVATYALVLRDVLDSLKHAGFGRVLIVNGHGGNSPAQTLAQEWMTDNPGVRIKFHNWWNAPRTWAKVKEIDPVASHASWMENFTWTRLAGVTAPSQQKPMIDFDRMRGSNAQEIRVQLGDGNFGGYYERSDDDMAALWAVAVEETRALIDTRWD
jgi:creatinine amidohydrolase